MNKTLISRFHYSRVYESGNVFIFESGLDICADGAKTAYSPPESGLPALDWLENAGTPHHYYGIATSSDNIPGKEGKGTPIIQTKSDPAPGYYISTTAFQNPRAMWNTTDRYVDSEKVTYVVIPSSPVFGRLGDFAMCFNPRTGDSSGAVIGDIGPANKVGECSIACANNLSVNSNAKYGGVASGILTLIFPGTGAGWITDNKAIALIANMYFKEFGGFKVLKALFPEYAWRITEA